MKALERAIRFTRTEPALDEWMAFNPTCECPCCASKLRLILWAALDAPGKMPAIKDDGSHHGRAAIEAATR